MSNYSVEKLLEGGTGNNSLLELTWNNIGDYYTNRQSWDKAAVYYNKANNSEKLADCLYALGDWDSLGALLESLCVGSPLFVSLAKKFANVGICKHAVSPFCLFIHYVS
jgi:WD repeat-containing protein 35